MAEVQFPGRSQPTLVSTRGNSLLPHPFAPGDQVRTGKGRAATITGEEPGGRGLRRYVLRYEDGRQRTSCRSRRSAPRRPDTDVLTTLRDGRVGDARAFLLRRQALTLDDERRNDALGALLASRVMVKPHQVGVVQRVLSARRPRFVLADEVGLGKTIEAGMIFSALRLSGLAAPSAGGRPQPPHRAVAGGAVPQVQPALHADGRRSLARAVARGAPDVSPWERFPRVVTSLELLCALAEETARRSPPRAWDLVIIDEAHHLRGERAFAAVEALASQHLGAAAAHRDADAARPGRVPGPAHAPRPGHGARRCRASEARVERQEELSAAVRGAARGKRRRGRRSGRRSPRPLPGRRRAREADRPRGAARPPRGDLQPLRGAGAQPPRAWWVGSPRGGCTATRSSLPRRS